MTYRIRMEDPDGVRRGYVGEEGKPWEFEDLEQAKWTTYMLMGLPQMDGKCRYSIEEVPEENGSLGRLE